MLAIRLILALIIIGVMGLGIAGFVPHLDCTSFIGITITIFVFSSCLFKLCISEKIKTVYLCLTVVAAYSITCAGHLWAGCLSGIFAKLFMMVYGPSNCAGIGFVSMFFWLGFVLVTTLELYRKPEKKLSIWWKIYAVFALANILAVIGVWVSIATSRSGGV